MSNCRFSGRCTGCVVVFLLVLCLGSVAGAGQQLHEPDWRYKVDDGVLDAADRALNEPFEFLVFLDEQADLRPAALLPSKQARGRYVYETRYELAVRTQAPLIDLITAAGAEFRSFWIANLLWVRGDGQLLESLARRDDVARIHDNPRLPVGDRPVAARPATEPASEPAPETAVKNRVVAWNIEQVGGPEVWAEGITGQGAVVGVVDTGCDWQHPALIEQYRGWDGVTADHDYNWHDAIHSASGPCGPDSPEPCDNNGHGTHVTGTAVGDDGEFNQIGLAPGAKWIGCRSIYLGWASPITFIECLEWMIAPYPIGGGPPDPDLAPHVVNNSWSCVPGVGCNWYTLLPIYEAVRAAGIVIVARAYAGGPDCSTIQFPPAIYDEALTVGATDTNDDITSFSGRGPVLVDGSGRLKPDVCAPGIDVLSCLPDNEYAYWSGTASAAAHLSGLVALVIDAAPELAGDVDALETIVTESAVHLLSSQCGDGSNSPNNVYGYGRIDAPAAIDQVMTGVGESPAEAPPASQRLLVAQPNPFNPRTVIHYRVPTRAGVSLRVYDTAGRLVCTLADDVAVAAGRHQVVWEGVDDAGRLVASGVYCCRLQAGEYTETRYVTLLK